MTTILINWPIIKVLIVACKILNITPDQLIAINQEQELFLKSQLSKSAELSNFKSKELRAWASFDAEALNTVLNEAGFPEIKFNKFESPSDFGVVSILDVLFEWIVPGDSSRKVFCFKEICYQAVEIAHGFKIHEIIDGRQIVSIQTKSGDTVYMAPSSESSSQAELQEHIRCLKNKLVDAKVDCSYKKLKFPVIKVRQQCDLHWLKGLIFSGILTKDYEIKEAAQIIQFNMDRFGGRIENAVMSYLYARGRCPNIFVIEGPFYFWIERHGLSMPIMQAYLAEDSFVCA